MNVITLNGITWDHPRGFDPLVATSEEYSRLRGANVKWKKRSLKDFGDQSLEDLASQFDLLIMDHPHSGVAAETGCVLSLDEFLDPSIYQALKSQSTGPSFESYNYAGHQWALPVDAAFQSACYRADLLNVQVPTNWDEVFQLAAELNKNEQYVGMALCPTDCLCTFLSLTAQFGSPIKEGNSVLVDERTGSKVLEMMARMRDAFHPMSPEWNPIQLYDHMAENDDIVYSPLAFNYSNYSRKNFRKKLLTYTNAPGNIAVLGGAGIAVSSNCQYPQEAIDYAAWICSADVQKSIYVNHDGQPANILAWEDPVVNKMVNDFFRNTRNTLDNAYVRPRYSGWPKFQELLGETIHSYLHAGGEVNVVLDKLGRTFIEMGAS